MPDRTVGRITSSATFAQLQRSRARGTSGPVRTVFVAAQDGEAGVFPQVGYAIGKRCGGAVTRNTLRRRARAVVRAEAPGLPRGTFLVRLDPDATRVSRAQFRADLATALQRAGQAGLTR